MPIVPTQRQSQMRLVQPMDPPDQKYLAMAAAMMHAQGKLFKPKAPEPVSVAETKIKEPA